MKVKRFDPTSELIIVKARRVHVFDLPDGFGIDGLIGLSFLRSFNVELRLADGRLLVDRVGAR